MLRLWYNRGYLQEGLHEIRRVLDLPGADTPTRERVEGLFAAGILARYAADVQFAAAVYEAGGALAEEIGWTSEAAFHWTRRAHVLLGEHDHVAARGLAQHALDRFEELDDNKGRMSALGALSEAMRASNDPAVTDVELRRLVLGRELSDDWEIAWSLVHLGTDASSRRVESHANILWRRCRWSANCGRHLSSPVLWKA
jgi:hypothetical protein